MRDASLRLSMAVAKKETASAPRSKKGRMANHPTLLHVWEKEKT